MNDSGHEREAHKRKIGKGSCEHVGPSRVREDDPTIQAFEEQPIELKGCWTKEEDKSLLEHGEYKTIS